MNHDTPPIRQWSFHALKDFEQCPYRLYLKRVDKKLLPEWPADHPVNKGIRLHKEAEDYISGILPKPPKEFKKHAELLMHLREGYTEATVDVEPEWAFTEDWEPTGWWDENVWTRIKPDAVERLDEETIHLYDWKTGNGFTKKLTHTEQGQLYAVAPIMRDPRIQVVKMSIVYTQKARPTTKTYTRDLITEFARRFTERAGKVTTALTFKPKPNRMNCRFCPFGVENGTGDCQYAHEP